MFNLGRYSGDEPELCNDPEPDKMKAGYKGRVDAGCDLFLIRTIGGNRSRNKLHPAKSRAAELSRISAQLGRDETDAAPREVLDAGNDGATVDLREQMGALSFSVAVDFLHESPAGLQAGAAVAPWVETISFGDEYRGAGEGFALADLPWVGT